MVAQNRKQMAYIYIMIVETFSILSIIPSIMSYISC